MKETDIIDPVRIGKFSLGYFRWSVTAHIFQPKRFWKYCTKQVYEWKEDSPAIYILDRHLYIIDVYFPYGRPAVHYIKRCTNAYLARIFIYIAKSSSSLADQIGIRSKRVVYLTVPVSIAENISHIYCRPLSYILYYFSQPLS